MQKREIIARILAIKNELKRRKESDRLARYNTGDKIHAKQMAFHKCPKRNRWVFGGNRSGKTECGAVEAVWTARGIHPYRPNKPTNGWVVSLSYEVQREVAQAKILSYLNPSWIQDVVMISGKKGEYEYGIIDYILVKNVFGSVSRIGFKSCDQGREKFQGASLDWVWFDEEPPKEIYQECVMRVLDTKGDIWGTMTPLKGLSWVYDEIYLNKSDNPQVWHEHIEWADNPFLDEEEVKMLSSALDKEVLESRRYGRFCQAEGLVYKEFDMNKHVVEPFDVPVEWQDMITIDPGLNNPTACLFCAVDFDGNVYVVAEHYEAGRDIDYHTAKIFELADKLGWKRDGKGRLDAIIDSAANQRTLSGTRSVAELFRDNGIMVNACVDKQLFGGIARVKQYFALDKIKIFSCCVNLIREIKGYWWSEGDNPIKKDDHALDALRYYVMTKPQPKTTPPVKPTQIQRDKSRLINELKRQKNLI
ncbi:MAG: terminase large subunit domain-containing protein [Christensenellales bacterium]